MPAWSFGKRDEWILIRRPPRLRKAPIRRNESLQHRHGQPLIEIDVNEIVFRRPHWRLHDHPRPAFWLFSCLGNALVAGFAVTQGVTVAPIGDLLMLAAVIMCGLGYTEGAKLSRKLGGWLR